MILVPTTPDKHGVLRASEVSLMDIIIIANYGKLRQFIS